MVWSLESHFGAFLLLCEAFDGQIDEPFAFEADAAQAGWDNEPNLYINGHGSLNFLHCCSGDS